MNLEPHILAVEMARKSPKKEQHEMETLPNNILPAQLNGESEQQPQHYHCVQEQYEQRKDTKFCQQTQRRFDYLGTGIFVLLSTQTK